MRGGATECLKKGEEERDKKGWEEEGEDGVAGRSENGECEGAVRKTRWRGLRLRCSFTVRLEVLVQKQLFSLQDVHEGKKK